MAKILNPKSSPGVGTAVLTKDERAALKVYLSTVGTRNGARALSLSRPTLTTAVLGGTMRPATATVIRLSLQMLGSPEGNHD